MGPSPASPSPPASPWPLPAACALPPCRLPSCCPPLPPSLTLTLLPSSSEPALPPSVLPGPELESAPSLAPSSSDMPGTLPEAAAVLLRHSWLRPLRGHGTLLSYDGFPPALRLLSTGCVECRHLAPEERLLFLSARCTAQRCS